MEVFRHLGIDDKWREIGQSLDSKKLDQNRLRNIRTEDNATAIRQMIQKCTDLKWYNLIGAVRKCCGQPKAKEMTTLLQY